LVEDEAIFEVKALEALPRIYEAQALSYLRRRDKREGWGTNVGLRRFREGRKGLII